MMTNFNSYINLSICWSMCFLVWGSSGNDGKYKSCHWADQYSNQKTWPVFPWNGRWRFSHATAIKVTISCLPVGLMEDIRLYITFFVNISSKLTETIGVQILVPWFERLVFHIWLRKRREMKHLQNKHGTEIQRIFLRKHCQKKERKMIRWFFWLFIFGLSFWSCHLCVNSLCKFRVSVAFLEVELLAPAF